MPDEQVTVVLTFLDKRLRSPKAIYRIHELADRLAAAVTRHSVGHFAGQESGDDELRLQFRGPNANRLYKVIHGPLLASLPSGYVLKRHGPPGTGAEERVEFYPPRKRQTEKRKKNDDVV